MGADLFLVYYGLRWELNDSAEEELSLLEERLDPRQIAARSHNLDCWWGGTTDEGAYYVLVGKSVGRFGWENESFGRLEDTEARRLMEGTREKLRAAGFEGEPAWHFHFEPDR